MELDSKLTVTLALVRIKDGFNNAQTCSNHARCHTLKRKIFKLSAPPQLLACLQLHVDVERVLSKADHIDLASERGELPPQLLNSGRVHELYRLGRAHSGLLAGKVCSLALEDGVTDGYHVDVAARQLAQERLLFPVRRVATRAGCSEGRLGGHDRDLVVDQMFHDTGHETPPALLNPALGGVRDDDTPSTLLARSEQAQHIFLEQRQVPRERGG